MRKVDPVLHERLKTLIQSMGYELVGGEVVSQGRQTVLRLYIDCSQGVTVDDCSRVSHQVSAMLDVEDPFQGHYTLEISSPGIDRPLFEREHYQQHVGSRVKIRLTVPVNQRKQYKGILKRVDDEVICLFVEELAQEVVLPFSVIEKANVIGEIHL